MHFAWAEIVERLMAALAAGGAIGLDREWLRKPAGLKTHMIFALASAMMSIMALEIYYSELDRSGGSPDATRILQGIITGMSFLGAGAIIRGQHKVHGLTTGAGIWLAGGLGMVFGLGQYRLGLVAVVLGLAVLIFIRMIEPKDIKKNRKKLEAAEEMGHEIRLPGTATTISDE
ncbi:MAG TPA: MgtC/SapB family protein [Alphaproteobacteria bacterium]|jgi:putative Mg2+ transporter-C (MgtC) family protein|nr:MgtC/SapB family protein [Alphaproteobacteria bacterium]